ncbi:unnamed protein product [Angiostrongylus costaricensis]|uniref:Uncharacterized protein n=1 Tax=Angiostrongylus costaricensis TaxID=334426 RepID=A0A0R3PZ23_ANGCS|nr:unnamed protein product [Angiostrongylus costaricensis]
MRKEEAEHTQSVDDMELAAQLLEVVSFMNDIWLWERSVGWRKGAEQLCCREQLSQRSAAVIPVHVFGGFRITSEFQWESRQRLFGDVGT